MDTLAETMIAGAIFKLIETTGQLFDVTGFHPDLPPINDISIGKTAIAYDHINGQTFIILFPQSPYFGRRL